MDVSAAGDVAKQLSFEMNTMGAIWKKLWLLGYRTPSFRGTSWLGHLEWQQLRPPRLPSQSESSVVVAKPDAGVRPRPVRGPAMESADRDQRLIGNVGREPGQG